MNHEYRTNFINESRIIEVKQDRNHEYPKSNDSKKKKKEKKSPMITLPPPTLRSPAKQIFALIYTYFIISWSFSLLILQLFDKIFPLRWDAQKTGRTSSFASCCIFDLCSCRLSNIFNLLSFLTKNNTSNNPMGRYPSVIFV